MIIGIDHGYYAMKTKQVCFPTGLMRYTYEPYTMQNVLQYGGAYYVCGTGRQTLVKAGCTGTGDSEAERGENSQGCSCSRTSPYRIWKGKTEI